MITIAVTSLAGGREISGVRPSPAAELSPVGGARNASTARHVTWHVAAPEDGRTPFGYGSTVMRRQMN